MLVTIYDYCIVFSSTLNKVNNEEMTKQHFYVASIYDFSVVNGAYYTIKANIPFFFNLQILSKDTDFGGNF